MEADAVAVELTGPGRGGVATVGVRGSDALRVVKACFQPVRADRPIGLGEVRYGEWQSGAVAESRRAGAGESVVVTAVDEQTVEVHCHGGRAAVAAILADLQAAGAAPGAWNDWLRREGKRRLEAEAEQRLWQTVTRRTAAIAQQQADGAMRRAVDGALRWRDTTIRWPAAQAELDRWLARWPVGQHLVEPWQVVLAGPPNVGKSSLLNALLGYRRAITFDTPGTTRDVVAAETVLDGWPIRLSDTAGIRLAPEGIERQGIARAEQMIDQADLVLWVVDAREPQAWSASPALRERKSLLVRNKADLVPGPPRPPSPSPSPAPSQDASPAEIWTVATAHDGDPESVDPGVAVLGQRIVDTLVGVPPEPGDPVPLSPWQRELLEAARDAGSVAAAQRWLRQLAEAEIA